MNVRLRATGIAAAGSDGDPAELPDVELGDLSKPTGLHLVDEAVHGDRLDPWVRLDPVDLCAQVAVEIGKGQERQVDLLARPSGKVGADLLVPEGQHAAASVLDDDDLLGPQEVLADHERADRVVRRQTAG